MPLHAPTIADIERLAQAAVERLPALFRTHLANVVLRVVDFPDDTVMAEMALESPYDILGLYQGFPVGDPGADLTGAMPATIWLYRLPILDVWAHGTDSLEQWVTHVLVHEVGHHFGLSDEAMHAIEDSATD